MIAEETFAAGLIETILRQCMKRREEKKEFYESWRKLNPIDFIDEHCTIRLMLPRQMGNTEAAVRAAEVLGITEDHKTGLIVAPYEDQARILRERGAKGALTLHAALGLELMVDSIVVDAASAVRCPEDLQEKMTGNGWMVLIG